MTLVLSRWAQAFSILRSYARNCNLRLADLAQAFIDGTEPPHRPDRAQVTGDR
jgi:hypothetical protein